MSDHDSAVHASVIIATLNAASTIGAVLDAVLAQQAPFSFEVVVSDNGSTDETRAIVESRASDRAVVPRFVDASQHLGAAYARNQGAAEARGALLLFCDHDDVPAPGWMAALARALDDNDLVSGPTEVERLNATDVIAWRTPSAMDRLPSTGFLPAGTSANLGVRRAAFDAINGFDTQFGQAAAGGDLDLFWRANLAGFTAGFASDALVHYRYRSDLRSAARQSYDYGRSITKLYRIYRAHGMRQKPLSLSVKQAGYVLLHSPDCFRSAARRGRWVWLAAGLAGRVRGSIENRVLYL